MIEGLAVLGLIPARGGSKRLAGKNIRPLAGRPLVQWTVETARASRFLDRLIISSDDPAIIAAAVSAGCEAPFVRPAELARDDTSSAAVALHALDIIGRNYDLLVLLQPTSPLRLAEDIDGALQACVTRGAPSCISVVEASSSPHPLYRLKADGRLQRVPVPADGASARTYTPNGAVYVVRVSEFRRSPTFVTDGTIGYPMPADRSIDIDAPIDFQQAEHLISERSAHGRINRK